MLKSLLLLIILTIIAGCQATGGGAPAGGIIAGHIPVDNKFTLSTPTNVTYVSGQTIPFTLTFPLDVTVVGGVPKLAVTIGSTVVDANFVSVSSNALLFQYIVQPGDSDLDGIVVSAVMNFNGATLTFNSGVSCNTTIAVPSLTTVKVSAVVGGAPVANNITPANFNEDSSSTITLSYVDGDGDLATSCAISTPTKVTVTTPCSCAAGVCTVGVTGVLNQNGAAGFGYTVTSLGQTSNTAAATFTLNPMPDAPVATNVTPPAFNEDTISTVTLAYTDADGDQAFMCSTSALSNVTVTTACFCAAGVCTVSVQGTTNYSGSAGFSFNVTANGQTSNTALAGLTITAVNDAPVNTTTTAAAFNEDTQSIITLTYTDAESQLATACSVTGETNVTETQVCACAAGVCTVGVTGTLNYNGAGGTFTYSVTAGAQNSTPTVVTFSINPIDDKPVGTTTTAPAFNENTQSIITLLYTDVESHSATTCNLTNLSNVSVTQPCACAAGTCTVGVTGTLNYFGAAGFDYTVTANTLSSDPRAVSFTINNVDVAPVATNITPGPFAEDSVNTITLAYTDADSDLATTCSVTGETNLTESTLCACAAGVCTVGITGAANYFGAAATFNYTVTANGLTSNSATGTITYTAVDDKPVGTTTTAANFNENTQSVITLAYTDVESDSALTCSLSALSNVTETQACACAAGTCTVGVTGTLNYFGSAGFSYSVTANGLASDPQAVTFLILNVDAAPVATNITPGPFAEDSVNTITLVYSDADSDLATTCSVTGETNLTESTACACAAGTCTVGITGAANYFGAAATFNYTVTANGLTSNIATGTITYTAVDDKPVGDTLTPPAFNRNAQSIISLTYTDVESHSATTCAVSSLSNVTETQACACAAGTCTVGVTGTFNYFGTAGFSYTVTANGLISDLKTATLTINNTDTAPVATNITPGPFAEDSVNTITLAYTDADSDQATTCSVTGETNVTESTLCSCAAGVCTVGITGAANYFGAAGTFNYTVTANGLTSNSATGTITYNAVDDKPVGTTTTAPNFNKNTQSIITLAYTDVESHSATTCTVSALSNVTETQACACAAGTCTVGVTGTFNYFGSAGLSYVVTANGLASDLRAVTFTIDNTNTPPVATNITPGPFAEDSVNTVTLAYTDVDTDLATTCAITAPTNLSVSTACACAAGTCTVGITGAANYFGAAGSFSYTVTANGQVSNSATSTITYTAVDDKPVGTTTTAPNFNKNTQSIITLAYTDVESHSATTCTVSALSNVTETQACACAAGTCTVGVTGTFNYFGSAGLSYVVTANGLASDVRAVTFTIDNTNTAPVATNITPGPFAEDSVNTVTLAYSDIDTDLATACSVTGETNLTESTLCSCAAGVCTVGITGAANYFGAAATFSYTVTANGQTSNSATGTITYTAVDDAPVTAGFAAASFGKNQQSIITLPYTDIESDNASSCSVTLETNVTETQLCACAAGTCTVGVTGTSNYTGAGNFTYIVTANTATSNASVVTFSITDTAPVVSGFTATAFSEDTPTTINLPYTDANGDSATTCSVTGETNVTETTLCACAAGSCSVGITGTSNYNGAGGTFNFTVTAGGLTSNSAAVTFTINPVDDKPTGVPLTPPAFDEDTQSTITLTYSDIEGDQAVSCTATGALNVTVTTACSCTLGTCTVGVTGSTNYNGTASFNYTVTANGLASDPQPVSLTITGVNDAPTTANITPAAFNEDVQSVITLTNTPVGGDLATTCAVTLPTNVTVTQACACSSGICTVGVTGSPANYNGAASFQWTVSAGSAQSTSRNAALTITPVDDAASLGAIATQNTTVNTATSAIAFTFNDVDGAVCSSARLSMSSSNTAIVANASVVWAGSAPNCTATITPTSEKAGTVTITITATDGGLANKTTAFTLNVNGAVLVWTDNAGTIINSYDFGTPGVNTTYAVRVRNDGNLASGAVTITDPGNTPRIGASVTSCTALAVNAFCSFNLTWTNGGAGGSGLKTETLSATHASGASSGAIAVQGTK